MEATITHLRCVHLGKVTGQCKTAFGLEPQHHCDRRGAAAVTTIAACMVCGHWLRNPPLLERPEVDLQSYRRDGLCPHPPGVVVDRYGAEARVADLYLGAGCFLILGGPSILQMPLDLLGRRGCLIMSINNCPAALPPPLRPHIWLHTDKCSKFSSSIWRDPGILKFAPINEWDPGADAKKSLRVRDQQGNLVRLPGIGPRQMPGVLGFARNTSFDPARWCWEPSINRGNDKESATGKDENGRPVGKKPNGFPHTINTMFAAVRLALYLGIARLYLLGADFHMSDAQPYAFAQGKEKGGAKSNNNAYANMCGMFDAIAEHIRAAGMEVYNCTPDSALWSFPQLPLAEAIEAESGRVEQVMQTANWYDETPEEKADKEKKKAKRKREQENANRRAKV